VPSNLSFMPNSPAGNPWNTYLRTPGEQRKFRNDNMNGAIVTRRLIACSAAG
jgi:hypothetical protein